MIVKDKMKNLHITNAGELVILQNNEIQMLHLFEMCVGGWGGGGTNRGCALQGGYIK